MCTSLIRSWLHSSLIIADSSCDCDKCGVTNLILFKSCPACLIRTFLSFLNLWMQMAQDVPICMLMVLTHQDVTTSDDEEMWNLLVSHEVQKLSTLLDSHCSTHTLFFLKEFFICNVTNNRSAIKFCVRYFPIGE